MPKRETDPDLWMHGPRERTSPRVALMIADRVLAESAQRKARVEAGLEAAKRRVKYLLEHTRCACGHALAAHGAEGTGPCDAHRCDCQEAKPVPGFVR